jgi:hypothetical protein
MFIDTKVVKVIVAKVMWRKLFSEVIVFWQRGEHETWRKL